MCHVRSVTRVDLAILRASTTGVCEARRTSTLLCSRRLSRLRAFDSWSEYQGGSVSRSNPWPVGLWLVGGLVACPLLARLQWTVAAQIVHVAAIRSCPTWRSRRPNNTWRFDAQQEFWLLCKKGRGRNAADGRCWFGAGEHLEVSQSSWGGSTAVIHQAVPTGLHCAHGRARCGWQCLARARVGRRP